MLRRFSFFVAVCLFLSLALMPGTTFAESDKTDVFDEVLEYIYNFHVDSPDLDMLVEGAIDGMIDVLEDPYTSYIPPQSVADFYDNIEGNYAGIGVLLEKQGDFPVAVDVFDKSPAQLAGMQGLDQIVRIDSKDIKDLTLAEVADLLRGPIGSKVTVTVNRGNKTGVNLIITRATVNAPTVFSEMQGRQTGYINITSFNSHTADDFEQALKDLKNKGITSLIMDLRGNPGGILPAAIDIAGHFIDAGKTVVTTEDRFGSREVYRSAGTKLADGIKVAILVDEGTASASEILAGALADYNRAVLVGEKTFGKGVVQFLVALKSGGSLKVTVQKYFTPSLTCIHGNGIDPDRKVLSRSLQLAAAQQELAGQAAKKVVFRLGEATANVSAEEVICEMGPYESKGMVYLPLRFTLEALGYNVNWLESQKSVEVSKGNEKTHYTVDSGEVVFKDGATYISLDKIKMLRLNVSQTGKSINIIEKTV